jgi:hypothetical protein
MNHTVAGNRTAVPPFSLVSVGLSLLALSALLPRVRANLEDPLPVGPALRDMMSDSRQYDPCLPWHPAESVLDTSYSSHSKPTGDGTG